MLDNGGAQRDIDLVQFYPGTVEVHILRGHQTAHVGIPIAGTQVGGVATAALHLAGRFGRRLFGSRG